MKRFDFTSFVAGVVGGILLLLLFMAGTRTATLFRSPDTVAPGTRQLRQGNRQGFNLSNMAERLGMTEAELQTELQSGKTFRDIAAEKGIDLGSFQRGGSGSLRTGSGAGVRTGSGFQMRGAGSGSGRIGTRPGSTASSSRP